MTDPEKPKMIVLGKGRMHFDSPFRGGPGAPMEGRMSGSFTAEVTMTDEQKDRFSAFMFQLRVTDVCGHNPQHLLTDQRSYLQRYRDEFQLGMSHTDYIDRFYPHQTFFRDKYFESDELGVMTRRVPFLPAGAGKTPTGRAVQPPETQEIIRDYRFKRAPVVIEDIDYSKIEQRVLDQLAAKREIHERLALGISNKPAVTLNLSCTDNVTPTIEKMIADIAKAFAIPESELNRPFRGGDSYSAAREMLRMEIEQEKAKPFRTLYFHTYPLMVPVNARHLLNIVDVGGMPSYPWGARITALLFSSLDPRRRKRGRRLAIRWLRAHPAPAKVEDDA